MEKMSKEAFVKRMLEDRAKDEYKKQQEYNAYLRDTKLRYKHVRGKSLRSKGGRSV